MYTHIAYTPFPLSITPTTLLLLLLLSLSSAKGVLVVCDLTREKTFEAVRAWKKEIDEWAITEGREGIPVVLIANKVSLSGKNVVSAYLDPDHYTMLQQQVKKGINIIVIPIDPLSLFPLALFSLTKTTV